MNPFSLPGGAQPSPVVSVSEGLAAVEGNLPVLRLCPTPHSDGADPFVLIDRWGPATRHPHEGRLGIEPHPHCHIEVLTLVRRGAVVQRASLGPLPEVHVGPGEVGWLIAGAGVVHDEWAVVPDDAPGQLDAVQVWVALPRRRESCEPELRLVRSEAVPVVQLGGESRVRVLAGSVGESTGPVECQASVTLLHAFLEKDTVWKHPLPGGQTALVMVLDGEALIGPQNRSVRAGQLARLGDGTQLSVQASRVTGVELLLLVGRPLHQPVARFGPFVARDEGAIRAAMMRFQRGRMGQLR